MIDKTKKQEVVKKFGAQESDTGSSSVQVALLTERINDLTRHLELNRKDYSSKRGLLKLVGTRRRLLSYLEDRDYNQYKQLIKELGLRK